MKSTPAKTGVGSFLHRHMTLRILHFVYRKSSWDTKGRFLGENCRRGTVKFGAGWKKRLRLILIGYSEKCCYSVPVLQNQGKWQVCLRHSPVCLWWLHSQLEKKILNGCLLLVFAIQNSKGKFLINHLFFFFCIFYVHFILLLFGQTLPQLACQVHAPIKSQTTVNEQQLKQRKCRALLIFFVCFLFWCWHTFY